MNADELRALYPRASESFIRINSGVEQSVPAVQRADNDHREGKPSKPERDSGDAAQNDVPDQKGHSARYLVRVTNFRVRLLDEDNLIAKWHIDALRYSGLLPSDAPGKCKIEVRQRKVSAKEDERTQIEVWPHGSWSEEEG